MSTADREPGGPGPPGAVPTEGYPWHSAPHAAPVATAAQRGLRRAGLVTRVLANTIDFGVVVLLLAGGYAAVAAVRFLLHPSGFTFPAPSLALVLLVGAWVQGGYFTVSWAAFGRSYGDEVLGLRVVNWRGDRLRWAGAALRAALCVPFPIGLLWVAVSGQNRSAQDVVLRTSVVYAWTPAT